MNDLFLHYLFTDRAGRHVFDAFQACDNKRMRDRLGEVRIHPSDLEPRPEVDVAETTD